MAEAQEQAFDGKSTAAKLPTRPGVYVAGSFADRMDISLGHAGAVVEGKQSSASAKMALFDDYFGQPVFEAGDDKADKQARESTLLALAAKLNKKDYTTWVLIGDGEDALAVLNL